MHFLDIWGKNNNQNQQKFELCQKLLPALYQQSSGFLTAFPVEAHLPLVLLLALQGFVYLLDQALIGFGSVQEATGAGLLHHLRPDEAGQFTEAVGAVDDGVAVAALGTSQQEVAVCVEERHKEEGRLKKKN